MVKTIRTIEIPIDNEEALLEVTRILREENYSGLFNNGKDGYRFHSSTGKRSEVIIRPSEGTVTFHYDFIGEMEANEERFSRIQKDIEDKFKLVVA